MLTSLLAVKSLHCRASRFSPSYQLTSNPIHFSTPSQLISRRHYSAAQHTTRRHVIAVRNSPSGRSTPHQIRTRRRVTASRSISRRQCSSTHISPSSRPIARRHAAPVHLNTRRQHNSCHFSPSVPPTGRPTVPRARMVDNAAPIRDVYANMEGISRVSQRRVLDAARP